VSALIRTRRLELRPARVADLEAELAGRDALSAQLGVGVPTDWPPELYDEAAMRYSLDVVRAAGGDSAWAMYYMVEPDRATVVGVCGYKGPPDADGTVEVGYSVVREFRRNGYATEATSGLMIRAFAEPSVMRVVAQTLSDLTPSVGVLEKLGFRFAGTGDEPGVVRYEFTRADLGNAELAFGV
jgi:[ribosomal protein S5]-alanine N-acetyltransferase